jgi:toxin-antitoxin system PIN domain toxin
LDANILLYAVDEDSPFNERAATWLTSVLNGQRRVALPWQTIGAFVRISTHPRVSANPLRTHDAWEYVERWLAAPATWVPPITDRTVELFGTLLTKYHVTGNLVTDAQLAAIAWQIGAQVCSADSDFLRFGEITWLNPVGQQAATRPHAPGAGQT